MAIEQLRIPGITRTIPLNEMAGQAYDIRASIEVGRTVRGIQKTETVKLQTDDVIELLFDDNTNWLCSPQTLEELFPEKTARSSTGPGVFDISTSLKSPGDERGVVSNVILKVVNVLSKKKVKEKVQDFAADLEKKQLESAAGLFRLDTNFRLMNFTHDPSATRYVLFIHGTNSSTIGSFGELMNSPAWNTIAQQFGNNVLAFQHETLTKSPLQNVLDLVNALPSGISLTLITHSRGGLVGDVLARFCNADDRNRGFSKTEIAYLEKMSRKNDVDCINKIQPALKNKKINIDKYIRVACPAQGTTLASQRLDTFFNVGLNLIGVGTGILANPVYAAFKNLIVSVIDAKNDEKTLPGVEAMNPESPFLKVLNYAASEVKAEGGLWCIAGNCRAKLNLKALLIIASKLFYLKDNDLVVNTTSMYQGARRDGSIYYFFVEGPEVDHFGYFKNKKTMLALQSVLMANADTIPADFRLITQDQSSMLKRNALLKADSGRVFKDDVTGSRPILILLPGIMGSNLSRNNDQLWINYWKFLTGGLNDISIQSTGIKATSLVGTSYRKIVRYFEQTHDVVTFPFDWRIPMSDSADLLEKKIKKLLEYKQPIQMIGHSMGGVLIRDFITQYGNTDTWKQLNASRDFRIIYLGSPLGGSFRIPVVLFGRDSIIDKLSKIDLAHSKTELLNIFNKMPGLLDLLPYSDNDDTDFSNPNTWKKMQAACDAGNWPIPDVAELKAFKKYRDNALQTMNSIDFSKMVYIAGRDKETPCGYRIDTVNGNSQLIFLSTAEGDQSVTWDSGIPKKMIENGNVYYVNVTHGSLANEPSMFTGISELLKKGTTGVFSSARPSVRGDQKLFRSPLHEDLDLTEEGVERTLLGMGTASEPAITQEPIQVTVSHGDLAYARYPVLAGHFEGDAILFAETAIDHNLSGALSRRHLLGLYPGRVGTSAVELIADSSFAGAIIVGIGPFGQLTATELAQSVETGVCNYLLEVNKAGAIANQLSGSSLGVSALTIGCGYGGLSIDSSIRAILQGVHNANAKISGIDNTSAKIIQFVEIIEQYEDRALSCFHSVTRLEKQKDKILHIARQQPSINQLLGAKKRLPESAMEEWWNRITITRDEHEKNPAIHLLVFNQSTGGAKESSRDIKINVKLIEGLLEEMSVTDQWTPALAKTIFELLIPVQFKEQFRKQCNILWILDKNTASYPWELLQDNPEKTKPLSISAGMIRQLRTTDDRKPIEPVADDTALIIGDPLLHGFANQLPGAVEEANMVTRLLQENRFDATDLINHEYPEILPALFIRNYKIIHLAGHGTFDPLNEENSGMLIGDNTYLTPSVINQLPSTPELVFVNCCFLGAMESRAEKKSQSRYKLAANIGTQLIDNGVKAVVVAGWAVDDLAALQFSKLFYEAMFAGETFGDAVHLARKQIYQDFPDTNTWGAYQCYGDPFYKFREKVRRKEEYSFIIAQETEIELNNLFNELHTGKYAQDEVLERVAAIAKAVDESSLRNAGITEQEGLIYLELAEYDLALVRFEQIMTLENAAFSVKTLERYCNVRAKKYVRDFFFNKKSAARLRTRMNRVINDIDKLLAMSPTAERNNIMGSAYKRRSILYPTISEKTQQCILSADYYHRAYLQSQEKGILYALTNWLVAESVLIHVAPQRRKWEGTYGQSKDRYTLLSKAAAINLLDEQKSKLHADMNNWTYWQYVGDANVALCTALVQSTDSAPVDLQPVFTSYHRVWQKAGSKGHKVGEIEHLDWLIDILSTSRKPAVKKLLNNIRQLRDQLFALI